MVQAGTDGGDEDTPLESVVAGAVTFTTLTVAFTLLALGVPWFWVAFPVGFGGGMPLAIGLVRWYESRSADDRARSTGGSDTDAALADLRDRYARGELTDEEFEAGVERLLETGSVADAKAYVERERREADPDGRDGTSESRAGEGERA